MLRKLTALVCIFISILSIVNAQTITVTPSKSQVCPCHTTIFEIKVENPTTKTITYTFSVEGETKDWVTILPPEPLELSPGESGEVYAYVTAPCDAEIKSYKLTFIIKDSEGNEYKKDVEFEVINCYKISLSAEVNRTSVCLGGVKEITLILKNEGRYSEDIVLSTSEDWAYLSVNKISLDSNEERSLTLFIAPSNISSGVYYVNISAKSLTSYAKAELNLSVAVENCYTFEASLSPIIKEACQGSLDKLKLIVRNTGKLPDNYTIEIEEPKWVLPEKTDISLDPNSTKEVDLYIDATDVEEGFYTISALIKSKHANATITGKLKIIDCYAAKLLVSPSLEELCPCERKEMPITIANEGKFAQNFTLSIEAPEWIEVESKELAVSPGKTKSVNIIANVPCDAKGNHTVKITAKSDKKTLEVKRIVRILDKEACYALNITVTPEVVEVYPGYGKTVKVNITNHGKVSIKAKMELESEVWADVVPKEVEIPAGSSKEVYIYVAPKYATKEGLYDIDVRVISLALNKTLTVKVNVTKEAITLPGVKENITENVTAAKVRYTKEYLLSVIIFAIIAIIVGINIWDYIRKSRKRKEEEVVEEKEEEEKKKEKKKKGKGK